jgi:hypothetical protein
MPSSRSSLRHSPAHWFSLYARHTLSLPVCEAAGCPGGGEAGKESRSQHALAETAVLQPASGSPGRPRQRQGCGVRLLPPPYPLPSPHTSPHIPHPHPPRPPRHPPAPCTSTRCRSTGGAGCRTPHPAPPATPPPTHPRWRSGAGWPRSGPGSAPPGATSRISGLRGGRRTLLGRRAGGPLSHVPQPPAACATQELRCGWPAARMDPSGLPFQQPLWLVPTPSSRAPHQPSGLPAACEPAAPLTAGVSHVVDLGVAARGVPKPPVLRLVPLPALVGQHLAALHAALPQDTWQRRTRVFAPALSHAGARGEENNARAADLLPITRPFPSPLSAPPPGKGCPAGAALAGTQPAPPH